MKYSRIPPTYDFRAIFAEKNKLITGIFQENLKIHPPHDFFLKIVIPKNLALKLVIFVEN